MKSPKTALFSTHKVIPISAKDRLRKKAVEQRKTILQSTFNLNYLPLQVDMLSDDETQIDIPLENKTLAISDFSNQKFIPRNINCFKDNFNVDVAEPTVDSSQHQVNNYQNSNKGDHYRFNLSLAETIASPPNILKLERSELNLLAETCQLEDLQALQKTVWFKILLIENDDKACDRLSKMLHDKDTQIITAKESKTGIKLAQRECPDLILCELMMPEIDGYGIKYFLKHSSLTNEIPLLFITTHVEQTDINAETILIVDKNRIKPVTKEKLCNAIADKLVQPAQLSKRY